MRRVERTCDVSNEWVDGQWPSRQVLVFRRSCDRLKITNPTQINHKQIKMEEKRRAESLG